MIYASDPNGCARRTQGFILVRTKCPYIQSAGARVIDLVCSRGYKQMREEEGPKSLVKRVSLIELFVHCQVSKPSAAQTC